MSAVSWLPKEARQIGKEVMCHGTMRFLCIVQDQWWILRRWRCVCWSLYLFSFVGADWQNESYLKRNTLWAFLDDLKSINIFIIITTIHSVKGVLSVSCIILTICILQYLNTLGCCPPCWIGFMFRIQDYFFCWTFCFVTGQMNDLNCYC